MIPVTPAPPPPDFDLRVRQLGLIAIAELVGEAPVKARPGKRRTPVAARREDLKPSDFPPFWRNVSDDLLQSYDRICSYSCIYIERVTGTASVDHFAAKSMAHDQVYEWSNYRLACITMNSRKRAFDDVIDPFDVVDGLFALDLLVMHVVPGPAAANMRQIVLDTIDRLQLNRGDYPLVLAEYFHAYHDGEITIEWLTKRVPFLAQEMRRQGQLLESDAG